MHVLWNVYLYIRTYNIYNVTPHLCLNRQNLLSYEFCEDLFPEGGYWGSSVVFGCHWQLYSICSGRYGYKKDMDVFEYPQPLSYILYQLLTCIAVIWYCFLLTRTFGIRDCSGWFSGRVSKDFLCCGFTSSLNLSSGDWLRQPPKTSPQIIWFWHLRLSNWQVLKHFS